LEVSLTKSTTLLSFLAYPQGQTAEALKRGKDNSNMKYYHQEKLGTHETV
jgi:hypothetical protein